MVRILAISDEEDPRLTVGRLRAIGPDLVVSCGDLGPDYVDYVGSAANAPVLFVPGNHDPDIDTRVEHLEMITNRPPLPPGVNLDGRIVEDHGLEFAGLGGSVGPPGRPNRYSQRRMRSRVGRLIAGRRIRGFGRVRPVDVFVAHSPPLGVGDREDAAHRGFAAFHRIIRVLEPRLMLHGHIHPHGFPLPDGEVGSTRVLNVIPHRVVEIPGDLDR